MNITAALLMKNIYLTCFFSSYSIKYKAWQRYVQGHSFILRPSVQLNNEDGKTYILSDKAILNVYNGMVCLIWRFPVYCMATKGTPLPV